MVWLRDFRVPWETASGVPFAVPDVGAGARGSSCKFQSAGVPFAVPDVGSGAWVPLAIFRVVSLVLNC